MRRFGSRGDEMRTEFVCIPRPITRSDRPDGGPLRYRVVHTAKLWRPGERPQLDAAGARRRPRPLHLGWPARRERRLVLAGAVRRDRARLRPADRHRARLRPPRPEAPARASPACAPSPCSGLVAGLAGLLGAHRPAARGRRADRRMRRGAGDRLCAPAGPQANGPMRPRRSPRWRPSALGFIAGFGEPGLRDRRRGDRHPAARAQGRSSTASSTSSTKTM